ncbi:MAG: DUF5684 domain-containing protein [Blastocatellia bacterium]
MESDGGAVAGGLIAGLVGLVFAVVALALVVVMIASMWKIFDKAGKPGWAAIIPIYNIIVLLEIIEKPIWWIVLFFLPFVNVIAAVLIDIELAKKFGKDALFGIGLLLLPIVFFPILAFGSARYKTSYY